MPIVLGNPDAATTITMVSNPFCAPCAKAHKILDQLLKTRDDIKVKIIFTTRNDVGEEKAKVSQMALSVLNDTALLERALSDWYAQRNKKYELWAKKYPVKLNMQINELTEKQNTWFDLAEVKVTPTIFVDGYKLPDPYTLDDVKYLVE